MDGKDSYNVMAVYSLMPWSGRDLFAGTLEEISNKRNWRLHTTRPGRFFSKRELLDENGDESLFSIDDDEEFDRVADFFDDMFSTVDFDQE